MQVGIQASRDPRTDGKHLFGDQWKAGKERSRSSSGTSTSVGKVKTNWVGWIPEPASSSWPNGGPAGMKDRRVKSSPPVTGNLMISPSGSLSRTRMADHLVSAPGVSFAPSLAAHSARCGTERGQTTISSKPVRSRSRQPDRCLTPSRADQSDSHSQTKSQDSRDTKGSKDDKDSQDSKDTQGPKKPEGSKDTPDTKPSSPSPSISRTTDKLSDSHPDPPIPSATPIKPGHSISSPNPKPFKWADLLRSPNSNPNSNSAPVAPKAPKPIRPNGTQPRRLSAILNDQLSHLAKINPGTYIVPRGLINNGNICFANAILQVLLHCPPFYNLLSQLAHILPPDLGAQTPLLDAMISFIGKFDSLSQPPPCSDKHIKTGEPFIAEAVWLATKGNPRFDRMRRGQQEDAQEFLCFFLDTLHEEILAAIDRHDRPLKPKPAPEPARPPPDAGSGNWLEVGPKGRPAVTRSTEASASPLTRLFDLHTRSVLHRPGQKDSVTIEPGNMLQLSLENASTQTIEHALASFSAPDVLSDMRTHTGLRQPATKQVYLDSFPPVLVLHLKRFHYDSSDGTVRKSHKQVAFGDELRIPDAVRSPGQRGVEEVLFQLFAAVYHHGPSAAGGHYTVAIRQQCIDRWIYIDDTNITPISLADVVSSTGGGGSGGGAGGAEGIGGAGGGEGGRTPYLLFYTRR